MNNYGYTNQLKHYPDILNAEQAAEILDISKKTLYKTIKEKRIPAIKIGREYRIAKTNLMKIVVL